MQRARKISAHWCAGGSEVNLGEEGDDERADAAGEGRVVGGRRQVMALLPRLHHPAVKSFQFSTRPYIFTMENP